MRRHFIPQVKMNVIRRRFIAGTFSAHRLAAELKISQRTVWRYQKEFQRIQAAYPDRLQDMDFYMPEPEVQHRATPLYVNLLVVLPELIKAEKSIPTAAQAWQKYRMLNPDGYTLYPFKTLYYDWLKSQSLRQPSKLIDPIPDADLKVLTQWRHGNDHRRWQIATVLIAAQSYDTIARLIEKAYCEHKSVYKWLNIYRTTGLKGFERAPKKLNKEVSRRMKERKGNLVKLLHESPKHYGINRTSWTILALTEVFNRVYPVKVSYMQISHSLRALGYRYKKSRDMLTSPDPKFREKIDHIQHILQRLKPTEKFFSIDEYGPVGIRIKGGRTLKQATEEREVIPEKQKCKGYIICTAALELSTNQVTHFYSLKKNTFEMIKLLEVLIEQYANQETLYLCWDAVSWHNSKILKFFIEDHNKVKTPKLKLAPLPACTQFLNVIESVFCGLAKAVIHNSNYASTDDCKSAIDLHFNTRNQYFRDFPKQAGRKIWGKELVKARFSETQHTRNPNAMRGARPE